MSIAHLAANQRRRECNRRQGIFWLLTIPQASFVPFLPPPVRWIRGQLELGVGGFLHWQIMVAFTSKKSLAGVRETFGHFHAELSRSGAASEYVWKEDTRVLGTQFELGRKPIVVSSSVDWESVWDLAKLGRVEQIPAHIRVQSYRTLKLIGTDHIQPAAIVRRCFVFWGRTGTGKSRRAWEEAGLDAYPKDPRTKFWCGYRDQRHVVVDEFRGGIDAGHFLRWLDRYPVIVEVKGSSVVLVVRTIWITSNLSPHQWYPDLDSETKLALLRRLEITYFDSLPN